MERACRRAAIFLALSLAFPAYAAPVFLSDRQGMLVDVEWQQRLSPWELLAFKPRSQAGPALDPDSGDLIAAARDGVHALTEGGRELWFTPFASEPTSAPVVTEGGIYLGAVDGKLHALDRFTGEELWKSPVGGVVLSRPLVHDGVVVTGTDHDTVQALDAGTGKLKWTYQREGPAELTIRGGTAVSVGDNRVYAGFSDGTVVALSPTDGRLLWEARLGAPGPNAFPDVVARPIFQSGTVYGASYADGVFGLDAATGQVRWKREVRGTVGLELSGDVLYAGGADVAMGILARSGEPLFRITLGGAAVSAPIIVGEVAMFPSERGILMTDKKTGRPLGVWNPGSGFASGPVARERAVFALSNDGFFYRLRLVAKK